MTVRATALSIEVEEDLVEGSSPLDECIFGIEENTCFELPLLEQQALRRRFVDESVAYQMAACPMYRSFAHRVFERQRGGQGMDGVPVLPTAAFKGCTPLSVAPEDVAKWCTSSGTRGKKSIVGRDRVTLERLLGSVRAGLGLIEQWYEHELHVVNLGPDRKEAGDLWFAYVMSLVELSFATTHEVVNDEIDYAKCFSDVQRALDESPHVGIVGPPFRVLELTAWMAGHGCALNAGNRLTVVTAGGWKRASGAAVPRSELESRIGGAFGIDSMAQYRDVFNQVELNTVLFECEGHRKHVPPWVDARARDPRTLAPVAYGEPGLLSFVDASARSYPAFIVGDDVGVVDQGTCSCGREGFFVNLQRRVEGRAVRGCALAMDEGPHGSTR